jgi:hypothetical protein
MVPHSVRMARQHGSHGTWLPPAGISTLVPMNELLRLVIVSCAAVALIAGCAGAAVAPPPATPAVPALQPPAPLPSDPLPEPVAGTTNVTLVRSPTCGCCGGHGEHLAAAGYEVSSLLTDGYSKVKDAHGIPLDMRSCHTTLVGRYFVEGHVPAAAIEQLLREMPEIDGIALPGMPAGSPGMGGIAADGLTVWAIDEGEVVGEFGHFDGVAE